MDGLTFADFSFEDVDAKWVKNFSLNSASQGACAVNRIVTFARKQFLRGIGELERDLLLLETLRQSLKLNFDNLL